MTGERVICPRAAVTHDSTVVFTAHGATRTEEAFLIEDHGGQVRAYANRCPHLIDVRLDRGAGARVRDGELLCQRHGATFDPLSGRCTFGPPEGAIMEEFEISVTDMGILLTDERFEAAERGLNPARGKDRGE